MTICQSSRRGYDNWKLHDFSWSLTVLVLGLCCCSSRPSMVTMVSSALTAQCTQEAQLIVAACQGSDATACCAQLGLTLASEPDCYCQIAAENSSDTSGHAQLLQLMQSICLLTVPPSVVACLSGEASPSPIGAPPPIDSTTTSPPPMEVSPPSDSTTTSPPPVEAAPPPVEAAPPPVEASPPLDSTTTPPPMEASPPLDSTLAPPPPTTEASPPLMTKVESPPPPLDVRAPSTSPPTPPSTTSTLPKIGLFGSQASPLPSTPFSFIITILASSLFFM